MWHDVTQPRRYRGLCITTITKAVHIRSPLHHMTWLVVTSSACFRCGRTPLFCDQWGITIKPFLKNLAATIYRYLIYLTFVASRILILYKLRMPQWSHFMNFSSQMSRMWRFWSCDVAVNVCVLLYLYNISKMAWESGLLLGKIFVSRWLIMTN